ncbi:hypothetical protein [Polaribacter sp.]|uniref:DUF7935 family protein n=1 Tax=Polaribacter sp. TaxID=1920175 RepID=UPI0025E5FB40|nr:hypothetical protein [Polaribacter sp.]
MEDILLKSTAYILPSVVTGFVAYFMFKGFLQKSIKLKKIESLALQKKDSLSIKLQAYERMTLFCDRVNPIKLVVRIAPNSDNISDYLQLLIASVEQELEHNFVQQIYISKEAWMAIIATKTNVIKKLQYISIESISASNFRENVLIEFGKTPPIVDTALEILKKDVKQFI